MPDIAAIVPIHRKITFIRLLSQRTHYSTLVCVTGQNVACNKELLVFMYLLLTGTLGLLAA